MKMAVAIVIAVLVAVTGILGFVRLRQQPRFPDMGHALSDADYAAMVSKPGWQAQRMTVSPGIELRGLLREPATQAGPWVMFFSGNSADVLREGQQFIDALCAERGWGGVVWAYRGYDSSGGTPDGTALAADGFKAYSALLTERKASPGAVHLVGFSMGTSMAAAVAARASSQPPASLTLLAPMTKLYHGDRTQLRLHRYETLKWLPLISSPVLVVHGLQDVTLPIENGRAVAAALGPRATLVELPGVGHYELPLSPGAQQAIRGFIAAHLQ
jgi:hypothetical protein